MRYLCLDVDLLLQDWVWEWGGASDPDAVNSQGWVTLAGGVLDGRVLVAVVAIGVAQTKPVIIVLCDAGHEQLDHIATVGDFDLGLAEAGVNLARVGRWDQREWGELG